ATDGLAAAQAGTREAGVGIDSGAAVGSDFSGRSAADYGVVFGKSNGNATRASDGAGAIRHQLQDFVQSEFFFFGESCGFGLVRLESAAFGLLMDASKGEERLQSVAPSVAGRVGCGRQVWRRGDSTRRRWSRAPCRPRVVRSRTHCFG